MPVSIILAMINGYALSFWRFKGSELAVRHPRVRRLRAVPGAGLSDHLRASAASASFGTLPGIVIVHTIFGMPILTLLFRNFSLRFRGELFKAARVDGAGFWRIFFSVMLPMSVPIAIVAVILQVTGIWNDFIFGAGVRRPRELCR